MSEKIQEKDLNNKESKIKAWVKKHKKSISNTFITLLAAGTLYYTADNWTSAQDRLESGETEARIEAVVKEQRVLIEAYNAYFDEYEAMGKKLVELQSERDLAGYKNTFKQREKLRKEIKNVEEDIDDLAEDLQNLKFDSTEGERQAARDVTPIPHAKGKERRTFKEYQ